MEKYFVEIKEVYKKSIVVEVESETIEEANAFALDRSANSVWEEDLEIENRQVENIYSKERWEEIKRDKDLEIEIIEAFMDKNDLDIVPQKIPISFIQDYKSGLR